MQNQSTQTKQSEPHFTTINTNKYLYIKKHIEKKHLKPLNSLLNSTKKLYTTNKIINILYKVTKQNPEESIPIINFLHKTKSKQLSQTLKDIEQAQTSSIIRCIKIKDANMQIFGQSHSISVDLPLIKLNKNKSNNQFINSNQKQNETLKETEKCIKNKHKSQPENNLDCCSVYHCKKTTHQIFKDKHNTSSLKKNHQKIQRQTLINIEDKNTKHTRTI